MRYFTLCIKSRLLSIGIVAILMALLWIERLSSTHPQNGIGVFLDPFDGFQDLTVIKWTNIICRVRPMIIE